MDGWMMDGSMDERMGRCMDGWRDGQMDRWINGWMDGRMDGWMVYIIQYKNLFYKNNYLA